MKHALASFKFTGSDTGAHSGLTFFIDICIVVCILKLAIFSTPLQYGLEICTEFIGRAYVYIARGGCILR